MEEKEMKALSMEDLDGVAGGYNDEEWAQWTRSWKD